MKTCLKRESSWTFVLLVLYLTSYCSSEVTVTDGGYEGITVALHGDVPEELCATILVNLQDMFMEGSNLLYSATHKRAFFREVNIVLPPSWNVSMCGISYIQPSQNMNWKKADIRVGLKNLIFGDTLWTQQSEGCGKRGDFISMSFQQLTQPQFLLGNPITMGQALVREWAKFRYGVFDEIGYVEDDIYPPTYTTANATLPNLCSNIDLWTCNDSLSCLNNMPQSNGINSYHPNSSILSMPYLSAVNEFCDDHTHKNTIPTKQNALCNGKSTKAVIMENSDFLGLVPPVEYVGPTFNYFVPQRPRMMILIENSQNMQQADSWRFLITSSMWQLIMKDLPLNTEVGVVSFNYQAIVVQQMTVLSSDLQRSQVYSSIYTMNIQQTNSIDLNQAISKGITELNAGGKSAKGSAMLIITSGKISVQNVNDCIIAVNNKGVIVAVVEYPGKVGVVQQLAEKTGGAYYLVQDTAIGVQSSLGTFINLLDVYVGILDFFTPSEMGGNPVLIYERKYGPGDRTVSVRDSFIIDSLSVNKSEILIYQYSLQPSHIPRKEIISPSGRSFAKVLPETVINADTVLASFNEAGTWYYTLERTIDTQPQFVRVTSKAPSSYDDIYIRFFTSATSQPVNVKNMPLILYVEAKYNNQPIVNAQVIVTIENLNPRNATFGFTEYLQLQLVDNGAGDPDITEGDGIYSHYLTDYAHSKGTFRFSVSILANGSAYTVNNAGARNNRATTNFYSNSNIVNCCGSKVIIPKDLQTEIELERFVQDVTIEINEIQQDVKQYRPGRVGDFRVTVNDSVLIFQWTGTGGNYDSGPVLMYRIKSSEYPSILYNNFSVANQVLETGQNTNNAGFPMKAEVNVTQYDTLLYYAIAAQDAYHFGSVSNVISVFVPHPYEPAADGYGDLSTTGTPNPITSSRSERDDKIIIIVLTIVGSLIIIAIVLATYFYCCVYRKKKKQQEAYAASAANLNGGKIREQVDVQTLSLNNMSNGDIEGSNGSVSVISDGKTLISPVQSWSASQLLVEHEKRQSPYGHIEGLVITDENGLYGQYPTDYYTASMGQYFPTEDVYYDEYGRLVQRDSISKTSNFESPQNSENTIPSDSFISAMSRSRGPTVTTEYDPCVESDVDKAAHYNANNIYESSKMPKVPPPTLPKPNSNGHNSGLLAYNVNLQGSLTSVNSDRKRRNITQV